MRNTILVSLFSLSLMLVQSAFALPAPQGETILWVSGKISQSNTENGVEFDQAMVRKLQQGMIKTDNHVVDHVSTYEGPKLTSLLEFVGASGTAVKVIAWDEYVKTISIEDIEKYGVLLATHEDGVKMTIDGKGPFFVVFPFSEYPELQNDFYYSFSVWQVREIVVE